MAWHPQTRASYLNKVWTPPLCPLNAGWSPGSSSFVFSLSPFKLGSDSCLTLKRHCHTFYSLVVIAYSGKAFQGRRGHYSNPEFKSMAHHGTHNKMARAQNTWSCWRHSQEAENGEHVFWLSSLPPFLQIEVLCPKRASPQWRWLSPNQTAQWRKSSTAGMLRGPGESGSVKVTVSPNHHRHGGHSQITYLTYLIQYNAENNQIVQQVFATWLWWGNKTKQNLGSLHMVTKNKMTTLVPLPVSVCTLAKNTEISLWLNLSSWIILIIAQILPSHGRLDPQQLTG